MITGLREGREKYDPCGQFPVPFAVVCVKQYSGCERQKHAVSFTFTFAAIKLVINTAQKMVCEKSINKAGVKSVKLSLLGWVFFGGKGELKQVYKISLSLCGRKVSISILLTSQWAQRY